MKIAIHQNHHIFKHSSTWDAEWIDYCVKNDIEYGIVDCFDNDILATLKHYDVLLWHFSNYSLQEMMFARSILNSAKKMGLKVFPDFNTSWHFDDKIAEMYLLKSINAPIPKSWAFYTLDSAIEFFQKECKYPIVAKLRGGSGSTNVLLLKDQFAAVKYAKRMFGRGFKPSPNILLKVRSNIQSAHNLNTYVKRIKRIPDFVESVIKGKHLPKENGYVYLQEYIPNDGFDLKVIVVNDKAAFLARKTRKGDFRASGSGSLMYDKVFMSQDVLDIAFGISENLGFQCMGYDFVIDQKTNQPKVIEMSYGFSHMALMELGGYWTKNGNWFDDRLNAPREVIRILETSLKNEKGEK